MTYRWTCPDLRHRLDAFVADEEPGDDGWCPDAPLIFQIAENHDASDPCADNPTRSLTPDEVLKSQG